MALSLASLRQWGEGWHEGKGNGKRSASSAWSASGGEVAGSENRTERKKFLRHYQLAPSQIHNSMGRVPMDLIPLEEFWRLLCRGDDKVEVFSELCTDDVGRQQVGVSRFAEVVATCADHMMKNEKFLQAVLEPKFFKSLFDDVKLIKPHADKVNIGKGGQGQNFESLRNLAYFSVPVAREKGTEESAKVMMKWLKNPQTPFKQFITLFGSGGLLFNAEIFLAGMQALLCSKSPMCCGAFGVEFGSGLMLVMAIESCRRFCGFGIVLGYGICFCGIIWGFVARLTRIMVWILLGSR